MNPCRAYYSIRPLIPRIVQISIRRLFALYKEKRYRDRWPIDPTAGKNPVGWQGWPKEKKFALVIQHDVDTQKGHDNCYKLMDLERRLNVKSLYSFVPERYKLSKSLLKEISNQGFGLGVHGLKHDGKLFLSEQIFRERAVRINQYLKGWNSKGFTSPSMHRNLDWMHMLDIEFCTSTFDTDPFEPDPEGVGTIFPFLVQKDQSYKGYVELPYTLPQDHLLFIILKEKDINIWKKKLAWIVDKGGMALLNTHPDYMNFGGTEIKREEYPVEFYIKFLEHVKEEYRDQYWHVSPKELAQFWRKNMVDKHSNI